MRLLLLLCLLFPAIAAAESRTWTDRQDRRVEAELLRVAEDSVILKLADGREVPYPLSKLSEADVKYVESARAALAAKPAAAPAGPNFDSPWPDRVKFGDDPEIVTVEENSAKKRFVYESASYRYICDVRLSKSVVKGFAVMFEASHLFCRSLPLGIDGGIVVDGKHQILLFEKFEDYVQAGGPPSSAGVFMGGSGVVMVPLTSLGVRPVGSGYMFDRDKNSSTLSHELAHQLTPQVYFQKGSMGWFTEGLAEYVAVTPYRSGGFNVRTNQDDIVDYVTGYGSKDRGGRALGKEISMPALKDYMLQDYGRFTSNAQFSYGTALLITYYFLHMDGEGDARRIKAFLKALHARKSAEDSFPLLLDGRTFEQLQEDIVKAWSRKGVEFSFRK